MKLITFPGKEEITIDKAIFDSMVMSLPITTKEHLIHELLSAAENLSFVNSGRDINYETISNIYDQFVNKAITNKVLTDYKSELLKSMAEAKSEAGYAEVDPRVSSQMH
jgi:hypothetical protein